MILFIVAFLLMALSFVMHQRSNTEVLGELQDSVSAMQEIQSTQDALLDLQDQLDDAEETVEALESAGEETQAALEAAEQENRALLALYQLQQLYAAGDLDGCRETLAAIEAEGPGRGPAGEGRRGRHDPRGPLSAAEGRRGGTDRRGRRRLRNVSRETPPARSPSHGAGRRTHTEQPTSTLR